ncbi:maestro heat-like repeat-containing protein family member 1 [Glossophaga mutica]
MPGEQETIYSDCTILPYCSILFPKQDIFYILLLLNIKIIHGYVEYDVCLELVDVIISYLSTMKPEIELEKLCTTSLKHVGSKDPQMVFRKLWDSEYNHSLPPRSLLVVVGDLSRSRALDGLITSAREHLCTGHENVMSIFRNELSLMADLTFRVILNRWSLKNKDKVTEQVLVIVGSMFYITLPSTLRKQVNRLTRWLMTLMSTRVTPFYISQCIWQLVDALALSGCGGMNLESQLENIAGMLFELLKRKVKPSDPKSVENHKLALRTFLILTKLYQDKLVSVIMKTMESFDPIRTAVALQVFIHVFKEVPQTTKMVREVMNSTLLLVQEDFKPVPKVLLEFIELLSQHNYLSQPEANSIIYYVAQLSEPDPTNEEAIQIISSRILQMVTLPKLIVLACYSSNISAIVPLNKAATEKALKVLSLGEVPNLSDFHLMHHSEENLSQKAWEDRLLQFLSESLVAINDDNWLQQLIRVVFKMITYFSDDGDRDKQAFLYKFFGFSLRTSQNEQVIKMMLSTMLQTSHEELQKREGIAVAVSVVSMKHLKIVLEEVRLYSAILTDKESSPILKLMKEHQRRKWAVVHNTICLIYGKIIVEHKGAIFMHLDGILALVLQHYHNCIVEKDKYLQQDYLDSLTILTNILSSQQHLTCGFSFPQKLSLISLMVELISEEPLDSISSPIRGKAMNIIADFRMLGPLLEEEQGVELLRLCFKSVFCLPPEDVLRKDASSPEEALANVNLLNATMASLQRLTEAVITEMPTRIKDCLELLDPWINSQKDNEKERAMQCAAHVFGFVATTDNFKMQIEITQLGHWVKLLAMCCQDPVDNICSLSSQAAYNLKCILSRKEGMEKPELAFQQEEDKSKWNLYPRNANDVGKAFAHFFNKPQLTNLVLTTVEELSSSRAQLSLASAQLMSAVIQERGTDLEKVEKIVEGILEQLQSQLEPSTKEETLRAMCLLAGIHTDTVVPLLLNKPLPWDRNILDLWKVFGTQRETTINILELHTDILGRRHTGETREMVPQRVLAACALYEMLSGSLCQDSIHELFPWLLLAVLCHLHWVIHKYPSLEVVYMENRSPGKESKVFNPASCVVEVMKLLLTAACGGVMAYTEEQKCWEHLCNPELYYLGVMELTSVIVKNCEPAILQQILNHIKNLLCSLDNHEKILARSIYAELLCHRSVAETLGQDIVGNLSSWIMEPDLIIKEIGLRGISNLALHPGKSESLKTLVPFLKDLLKDSKWRVRVQAVKALQDITHHGKREDIKMVFGSIAEQLRALLNDEKDEVRISATSALGHMLCQVKKVKPGSALRKEINSFLVPLLLSIQDSNADVVKACGRALTEWTKVTGWLRLTYVFQESNLSDPIHVLEETSNYLVSTRGTQFLGDLLLQSFEFLRSSQPFLRTAAVTFIAYIIPPH